MIAASAARPTLPQSRHRDDPAPGGETGPSLLAFHHVTVRFGSRRALDDVSFDLPEGTVTVLAGRNGAGKTTLLRTLTGRLRPAAGTVEWALAERRGRVALVAQAAALYPLLTLRENCLAAGRMEGLRGIALRRRADAVITATLCEGMVDQLAGHLSGGYARRAALAAALMGDAPLVVLDEPTAGLDAEATAATAAVLRTLRGDGKTVLLATHDFALADAVADRALFLRDGRLAAHGVPRELCAQFFPDRMRVEMTCAGEPDGRARALLDRFSAYRAGPGRFHLYSPIDAAGHAIAVDALRGVGLFPREIVLRDPGMAALFERFCLERTAS